MGALVLDRIVRFPSLHPVLGLTLDTWANMGWDGTMIRPRGVLLNIECYTTHSSERATSKSI
jgi:hypothetical protein